MKKKGFIALAAILWVMAGYQYINGSYEEEDQKVIEAFQNLGFVESECVIEAYGLYENSYAKPEKREQILTDMAESLGISGYQIQTEEAEGSTRQVLSKEWQSAYAKLQFVTMEPEVEGKQLEQQQYIFIELRLYKEVEGALEYRELVEKVIQDNNISAKAAMNLKGSYNGRLNLEERNKAADQMMQTLDAKVISDSRTDQLFTIYGNSSYLKKYGGNDYQKINISLAFTYDELEDRTFFYLASPVIQGEY